MEDVASVEMKFSEIPIKSYVNGQRSISFIIKKTPDEDLKKINSLETYIKKFNSENKDFEILTLFQFSDMLDQRIETLSDNLILGLILVLIVLGFFLSFRLSSSGCLWNSIFFYWYDIYWYSLRNDNKYDFLIWNDISSWNFSR